MKSCKARLLMVLTVLAMILVVSTPAMAHDEIEDIEVSDVYFVVSEDGSDIEACVDVTVEYTDDHEETFTECEDVF